ncbi:MAG: hypothetical protein AAFS12_00130 [Cyanobacteria bacterium J06632_19]
MKRTAARKVNLPVELDEIFFNLILAKVKNRAAALQVIEENLIATKILLRHFQGLNGNKSSEAWNWFAYFDLLRNGLHALHKEEMKLLVVDDYGNVKEPIQKSKTKREPTVRLPPNLNEIVDLLEPYKGQLEFNCKPKEGLEVLYWILESYGIAIDRVTPATCWLDPLLVIQKLPLLLFSDWREIKKWMMCVPPLTEPKPEPEPEPELEPEPKLKNLVNPFAAINNIEKLEAIDISALSGLEQHHLWKRKQELEASSVWD